MYQFIIWHFVFFRKIWDQYLVRFDKSSKADFALIFKIFMWTSFSIRNICQVSFGINFYPVEFPILFVTRLVWLRFGSYLFRVWFTIFILTSFSIRNIWKSVSESICAFDSGRLNQIFFIRPNQTQTKPEPNPKQIRNELRPNQSCYK